MCTSVVELSGSCFGSYFVSLATVSLVVNSTENFSEQHKMRQPRVLWNARPSCGEFVGQKQKGLFTVLRFLKSPDSSQIAVKAGAQFGAIKAALNAIVYHTPRQPHPECSVPSWGSTADRCGVLARGRGCFGMRTTPGRRNVYGLLTTWATRFVGSGLRATLSPPTETESNDSAFDGIHVVSTLNISFDWQRHINSTHFTERFMRMGPTCAMHIAASNVVWCQQFGLRFFGDDAKYASWLCGLLGWFDGETMIRCVFLCWWSHRTR